MFRFLCLALLVAVAAAITCNQELTSTGYTEGLYTTDGAPGLSIETYISFDYEGNDNERIVVCEMGVRFPHAERISHCVNASFCPPGAPVAATFNIPSSDNSKYVIFKSIGLHYNVNGHADGNYEEYRHYWENCATNPEGCDNVAMSWSYTVPHFDVHFFFVEQSEWLSIAWNGFPTVAPPADIQAKCNDEPPAEEAAPEGYYSSHDCVPDMGRHWIQDKLETRTGFEEQPSLIFGSYDGEATFWEPMVSANTFNWVSENGVDQQATISWPQPRQYFRDGWFPQHYALAEVTDEDKLIGGGRTVSVAYKNFVYREGNAARVAVHLGLVAISCIIALIYV